jgi:hypothetical protein
VFLAQKNLLLGVKKAKIDPQSPKTLGVQIPKVVWSCDISIGNFTWNKKKYTFGDQKAENKPSEPKNGI